MHAHEAESIRNHDDSMLLFCTHTSVVCIFIIGSRFFDQKAEVELLKLANERGVKCIPIAPPGATYLAGGYARPECPGGRFARFMEKLTAATTESKNPIVSKISNRIVDKLLGPLVEIFSGEEQIDLDKPHFVPENAWNRCALKLLPSYFCEGAAKQLA